MSTGASCAIGVDVGGTKIEAIVLDAGGHERWRERVASPRGDYDASLQAIVGIVERARQAAGGVPCTIGIGAPGNVTERGVIRPVAQETIAAMLPTDVASNTKR